MLNLTQRAEEYGPEILEAMMSQWSQLSRTLVDVAIGTGETSIVDAVLNAYKRTGRPVLPQILFEIAIENGAITRTVLKHIVDKYKPDLRYLAPLDIVSCHPIVFPHRAPRFFWTTRTPPRPRDPSS